eukprot:3232428-Pyramimonas_sp.AAC.1
MPRDPGSIASAAPDQETMGQVLADRKHIDRNEGDNETTLQAEATCIRADLARTCGHLDVADIGSTEYTGLPGDRLSLTEVKGIGRSVGSRASAELNREAMNQLGHSLASGA